jgi:hypothetical protein
MNGDQCDKCFRPIATPTDWDTIPEGEGKHLCWGNCEDGRNEKIEQLEGELARAWAMADYWKKKFTLEKQMRKSSDERADNLERGDYHPKGCGCSDIIERE